MSLFVIAAMVLVFISVRVCVSRRSRSVKEGYAALENWNYALVNAGLQALQDSSSFTLSANAAFIRQISKIGGQCAKLIY